jgi:hypothetical protein
VCRILPTVMGVCHSSGHVIGDVFSHMPKSTMSSVQLAAWSRPMESLAPDGQGGLGALCVRSERGR